LIRSFTRALAIQNDMKADEIPESWKSIDTNWRNPRYQSRAAEADAGTKQLSAVPWLGETEVGLELLGLTPQQRANALAERRRNSGRAILEALTAESADVDTSATQ
jgi:hypothetical protein